MRRVTEKTKAIIAKWLVSSPHKWQLYFSGINKITKFAGCDGTYL